MRRDRHAQDLARDAWFDQRRQAIGLAQSAQVIADAVDRAAQSASDPLGGGGEISLAVERRKNGAAHQGRAAQSGQYRSAKPLYREPAPVNQAAMLAVHGKRRLVAEVDRLGIKPAISAAHSSVIQSRFPLTTSLNARRHINVANFRVTRRATVLKRKARPSAEHDALALQDRQRDPATKAESLRDAVAYPMCDIPTGWPKNGRGLWPQCGDCLAIIRLAKRLIRSARNGRRTRQKLPISRPFPAR